MVEIYNQIEQEEWEHFAQQNTNFTSVDKKIDSLEGAIYNILERNQTQIANPRSSIFNLSGGALDSPDRQVQKHKTLGKQQTAASKGRVLYTQS